MEPSAELKEAVLRLYGAIAAGDIEAVGRAISRNKGMVVIGTDPDEWWSDYGDIVRVFTAQTDEQGGGIPIVAGDVEAYSEGDVGWFADRSLFKLSDGTQIPFRHTGVLHREDGDWRFVQLHASIGVSNEEEFGRELTT
jgi:adenylate cyclase